jgi:hypothetical protein
MLAPIAASGLEAVAAGRHGAPAAGPRTGSVEEPERAVRIGAVANPLGLPVEELKEAAHSQPRRPPLACDLERLACRGPVGAQAYATAVEDAVETGQRGRPGLLESSFDGVAGFDERPPSSGRTASESCAYAHTE